jgi:hypothetical protein
MPSMQFIPIMLVAMGVIFLAAAFGNYLRTEGKLTPARATWLRITCIFCGIAIAVSAWQAIFPAPL